MFPFVLPPENPHRRRGDIIDRALRPKRITTCAEDAFVTKVLTALRERYRAEVCYPAVPRRATTRSWGNAWVQVLRGTVETKVEFQTEWAHAGRRYRITVTKLSPSPAEWSWEIRVLHQRYRPAQRTVDCGFGLESLRDLAERRGAPAAHLAVPSVLEPEPVRWPATN